MNTYVVHGAPLSGKSTYVKERLGDNDIVFDFDSIMSAMTGKELHNHNENVVGYVLDFRDYMLSRLKCETSIDNAWIITTNITDKLSKSLVGLNPVYVEIKIDIATAKKRLRDNPGGRDIELWDSLIDKYFEKAKDNTPFYNSKEWRRKRDVILKRDDYQCKQCKRYGKVTPADTVHHIYTLSTRPDLKLDNRNLISLCESCHEKMHNKYSNTLSRMGAEWVSKLEREHPEIRIPPTL